VFDTMVDAGFVGAAGLCGILFFLISQGWIRLSPALAALILIAWCPLFWLKYWLSGRDRRWTSWLYFGCSAGLTLTAIIAALMILIRLIAANW
jgi:hypothetical protein